MEKISGIYRIVCFKNGRYYYGSSKNINFRWSSHKSELKKNKHKNGIMQRTWNKHGETAFRIEVTELVEIERLKEVEDVYLKEHVGKPNCMNIAKDAYCWNRGMVGYRLGIKFPEGRNAWNKGIPMSDAAKKKLSVFRCGRSMSVETKEKISKANTGHICSEKTKQILSIIRKGIPLSEDTKQKLKENHADVSGVKNPRYGKPVSKETRIKLSNAAKQQWKIIKEKDILCGKTPGA